MRDGALAPLTYEPGTGGLPLIVPPRTDPPMMSMRKTPADVARGRATVGRGSNSALEELQRRERTKPAAPAPGGPTHRREGEPAGQQHYEKKATENAGRKAPRPRSG
jgi:hypothetical protein